MQTWLATLSIHHGITEKHLAMLLKNYDELCLTWMAIFPVYALKRSSLAACLQFPTAHPSTQPRVLA
jgi:hypothetical protein